MASTKKKIVKKKVLKKKKSSTKRSVSRVKKPALKSKKTGASKIRTVRASANPKPIGLVTHYYDKIGVAIVSLSKPLDVGSSIRFKGATTDFSQIIASMQLNYKEISKASKGKEIGLKVKERVREGDSLFLS